MNTSSVPFRGPCIDFRCVFRSCPPACHPQVLLRLCTPPPPSLAVSSSASVCWIRRTFQALPPAPSLTPHACIPLALVVALAPRSANRLPQGPHTESLARLSRLLLLILHAPSLDFHHHTHPPGSLSPPPSPPPVFACAAAPVNCIRAATSLTARVYERHSPRPPAVCISLRPPSHQHSFGARSDWRETLRAQARSRGIRVEG